MFVPATGLEEEPWLLPTTGGLAEQPLLAAPMLVPSSGSGLGAAAGRFSAGLPFCSLAPARSAVGVAEVEVEDAELLGEAGPVQQVAPGMPLAGLPLQPLQPQPQAWQHAAEYACPAAVHRLSLKVSCCCCCLGCLHALIGPASCLPCCCQRRARCLRAGTPAGRPACSLTPCPASSRLLLSDATCGTAASLPAADLSLHPRPAGPSPEAGAAQRGGRRLPHHGQYQVGAAGGGEGRCTGSACLRASRGAACRGGRAMQRRDA